MAREMGMVEGIYSDVVALWSRDHAPRTVLAATCGGLSSLGGSGGECGGSGRLPHECWVL